MEQVVLGGDGRLKDMIIGFFVEANYSPKVARRLDEIRKTIQLSGLAHYESPNLSEFYRIEAPTGRINTLEDVECWLENK